MICIEVAHIYANETINEEHYVSMEIAKKIKINSQHRLLCLIDNYHANGDCKIIENQLKKLDNNLSFFYEKDLIILANTFVKNLTLKEKRFNDKKVFFFNEIALYEIKNNEIKYYCATLCAVWYLFRLGYFNNEKINKIINVLPRKYYDNEQKVLKILESTEYKEVISKIEYVWH